MNFSPAVPSIRASPPSVDARDCSFHYTKTVLGDDTAILEFETSMEASTSTALTSSDATMQDASSSFE
jgi:hypothetical protein